MRKLNGVMDIFTLLIVVIVSQVYSYVKTYQMIHLRRNIYQLYLNNAVFKITNIEKDMEKLEPFYTALGDEKWCNHFRKQFGSSSKGYIQISQF